MKILFIGNSYTYYNDMPKLFQKIAEENGKDVNVFSVTCGGHKLYEYADGDDEYTKQIDELIKTHQFDICILQEHSVLPIKDNELFIRGLTALADKLKPAAGAFMLYETWGRKTGSPTLGELSTTNKDMTYNLAREYERASHIINAKVSYVGLNFYDVYTGNEDIELYNEDMTHPSYEGSCLAALTHYYSIFGSYPQNTECLSLTDRERTVFKNTITQNLSV